MANPNAPAPIQAATPGRFIADGSTVAVVIKNVAGILCSLIAGNLSSSPFYLTLFDSATDPGTGGTGVWGPILIPAAATAADGGTSENALPPTGLNFVNGIVIHIHTGVADSDETAVLANNGFVSWAYL